jgi:hypothetical protein
VTRPRRRYELRNAELNAKIEELIGLASRAYEAGD